MPGTDALEGGVLGGAVAVDGVDLVENEGEASGKGGLGGVGRVGGERERGGGEGAGGGGKLWDFSTGDEEEREELWGRRGDAGAAAAE